LPLYSFEGTMKAHVLCSNNMATPLL
jgi:hypothetical protein